jgi:hypothetical protein
LIVARATFENRDSKMAKTDADIIKREFPALVNGVADFYSEPPRITMAGNFKPLGLVNENDKPGQATWLKQEEQRVKEGYEKMAPKNPNAPTSRFGGALAGKTLPGRKTVGAGKTLPSKNTGATTEEQSTHTPPKKVPARKRTTAGKTLPQEGAAAATEGQSTDTPPKKAPARKRAPAAERSKETADKAAGPAPKRRRVKKQAETAEASTPAEDASPSTTEMQSETSVQTIRRPRVPSFALTEPDTQNPSTSHLTGRPRVLSFNGALQPSQFDIQGQTSSEDPFGSPDFSNNTFGNLSFQDVDPFSGSGMLDNQAEMWGQTAPPSMIRSPYGAPQISWRSMYSPSNASPLRYEYNRGLNPVAPNNNNSAPSPGQNEQNNPSPFPSYNSLPAPQWQRLKPPSWEENPSTVLGVSCLNNFANRSDLSSNGSAASQYQASQANLGGDPHAGVDFAGLLNQPLNDLHGLARDMDIGDDNLRDLFGNQAFGTNWSHDSQ